MDLIGEIFLMNSEDVSWDLNVIYEGASDPRIAKILKKCTEEAKEVNEQYRGKIAQITTPKEILDLFSTVERISEQIADVFAYAVLRLSVDNNDKVALELRNKIENQRLTIRKYLEFLDIEVADFFLTKKEFLHATELSSIKHYIEKIVEKRPFKLSEEEEKLILEKDRFGSQEWSKLQMRWLATRTFKLKIDDKEQESSWSSGHKYFYDPRREVRQEAIKEILGDLGTDKDLFATCLRSICGNHVTQCTQRGYSNPRDPTLHINDISNEMLENMLNVVETNVDLFQEFLLLKAKLLGTEKLKGEDYLAPLPEMGELSKFSWIQAKEMILESYSSFNSQFAQIASNMFDNNRIDASSKPTKDAGAFCYLWYRGQSAFILMSFGGILESLQSLAHELGHGIHAYLLAEHQRYLNTRVPMVLAETASEFGGMLFTDYFLTKVSDPQSKKNFLAKTLEHLFNVIFEVSSRIRFEQSLYEAIEANEFLEADKITELFWKARKIYFGDAVEWLPEQGNGWCWKLHYYDVQRRYYNYPYVFGELLVLVIYNIYRTQGKEIVPKIKEFLKAGSSKSPAELVKEFGLDLNDPEFWKGGMNEVQRLFNEFKELVN